MRTMAPGERFMRALSFQSVDRIPVMDFGYWRETIDEWHQQGLPADVNTTEQVEAYFGCDRGFETNLINYFGDDGPVGIEWGIWPPFSKILVEETAEPGSTRESAAGFWNINFRQHELPEQIPAGNHGRLSEKSAFPSGPMGPNPGAARLEAMLRRGKEQGQAVGLWIDGYLAWPRILMEHAI